jgi:4-hydroxybenzoate polyprenyltransferase
MSNQDTPISQPISTASYAPGVMLTQLLRSMRPRQWTKNAFVFTALAFSEQRLWTQLDKLLETFLAFVIFCMAASAIYLVNDLVDIKKDRLHPRKRLRPLASGKLSPYVAVVAAIALIALSLIGAYLLDAADRGFLAILLTYIIVQGFLYSYWLKNIVILDILILAAGFVLRAVAGATVLDIVITEWLLVCMGLLAVFLGVGKRRHELTLLQNGAGEHRRILQEYSLPMLDQMISIVTASLIMAYSMTTFSAPAVPREPYPVLMVTIPFVVYGIFRYLYLIYQRHEGGSPDELVLKDFPLGAAIALWGITVLVLLYVFRPV